MMTLVGKLVNLEKVGNGISAYHLFNSLKVLKEMAEINYSEKFNLQLKFCW